MTDRILMQNLSIAAADRRVVDDVDLRLDAGQIVALVGASGSGKTLSARALLGLVDLEPGVLDADLEITVGGTTLRPYDGVLGGGPRVRDRAFRDIRGPIIGYLPQDARAALDPLFSVRRQVSAAARAAGRGPDPLPWLRRAGFRDPERVADLYPHELSGGMAQRVQIAQSIARNSRFLLADEPTTGLDPTVQAAIIDELRSLAADGVGILLITHDLRILPDLADTVLLMDGGRVIEELDPTALRTGAVQTDAGRRLMDATRRVAAGRLG